MLSKNNVVYIGRFLCVRWVLIAVVHRSSAGRVYGGCRVASHLAWCPVRSGGGGGGSSRGGGGGGVRGTRGQDAAWLSAVSRPAPSCCCGHTNTAMHEIEYISLIEYTPPLLLHRQKDPCDDDDDGGGG